jgi:hypothetical protein
MLHFPRSIHHCSLITSHSPLKTMSALRIVKDHPELDLGILPPAPAKFVCPASPKDDTVLRTSKGVEKKRFVRIAVACQIMGGLEPGQMRNLIRSGLIYAFQSSPHPSSWLKIDSVGVYLYRENQRRRGCGQPPTPAWIEYSEHMTKLNAANPTVMGPPPVPQ